VLPSAAPAVLSLLPKPAPSTPPRLFSEEPLLGQSRRRCCCCRCGRYRAWLPPSVLFPCPSSNNQTCNHPPIVNSIITIEVSLVLQHDRLHRREYRSTSLQLVNRTQVIFLNQQILRPFDIKFYLLLYKGIYSKETQGIAHLSHLYVPVLKEDYYLTRCPILVSGPKPTSRPPIIPSEDEKQKVEKVDAPKKSIKDCAQQRPRVLKFVAKATFQCTINL
jgi:hypothetical protein